MKSLLLIVALATEAFGATLKEPNNMEQCWNLMEKVGLSDRFPGAVSHAIHSITLQDLRHYFDANAKEENGIPMINLDLKDEKAVLMNAPNIGYEEKFMTMGLKAVDEVLTNMDNPNFDIAHYTILERLVHTLHMQEVWQMMKVHYDKLVANPPKDRKVCDCVKDVENNGVLKFMNYMALKIRYPEIMYGRSISMSKSNPETFKFKNIGNGPNIKNEEGNYDWDGNLYKFEFPKGDNQDSKSKGKYDWDGNLYKFEFPKLEKEDSKSEGNYDWDGNLYKFEFPKNEQENAKHEGNYGWDGNLYKFEFPKHEKEPSKSEKNYDWDGNLYKFEFPKGEKADGNYAWDGNLYKFEFPKDQEAKKGLSGNVHRKMEPWQVKDEGVKHISDSSAWKVWKDMMLQMDDGDHYEAAYFLYCSLN